MIALPSKSVIEAALAKKSLHDFVQAAWGINEPDQTFLDNWHIRALCGILEKLTAGDYTKLVINIPPGTMKSLLVSVLWPAWLWARTPSTRILAASYSASLSIRDNLRFRNVILDPWYREHYGVRLSSDQAAKERLNNTAGGWRIATSGGGLGTGEHPDIVVVDDPHTAEQARSDAERQRALDWMDRTISTRGKVRNVKSAVIMQRLHERDLSGHLLEKGDWDHVCWPMRFDPERADEDDPRTVAGELFWPALYPEDKVRELELALGPYGTAGQLQQRPAPEGGGLFRREWFEMVEAAPVDARRCRGWDTAGTQGGGDWTVGVKIAKTPDGLYFVEDVTRAQLSPAGVDALIRQTAFTDGLGCWQREEEEPGSSGKAVIAHRARLLAGFDYRGEKVTGDKTTRAGPFRAQAEAGNVKVVKAAWNAAYLQELEGFPTGAHDDQVDASSCAFGALALRKALTIAAVFPVKGRR